MRYERWGQAAGSRAFRWWAVGMAGLLLVTVLVVMSLARTARVDTTSASLKDSVSIIEKDTEDLAPTVEPLDHLTAVAAGDVRLDLPARWLGDIVTSRLDLDALREPDGPASGGHLGLTGSLHPTALLVAGHYPASASVWRIVDARGADVVAGVRRATEREAHGTLVSRRPVATAMAGTAQRLEFSFPRERHAHVRRVFYVLADRRGALILRYTTDDIARTGPVADRIATSLRVTRQS